MNTLKDKYWACYRWIRDRVSPIWYRFFGYRFHIVKTGLTPRVWIDTDTRMLYAVMALVEWFVDNDMMIWTKEDYEEECERLKKEYPNDEHKELEFFKEQYAKESKIIEIANWWKNYPNREKEVSDALDAWFNYLEIFKTNENPRWESISNKTEMSQKEQEEEQRLSDIRNNLEEKLEQEEQEMLKLAIELRNRMWS